jgi:cytochrome c oxidase assembly factor CtaG
VVALVAALPPAGSYARQYLSVQAIQFVIFAAVAPALLALGWSALADQQAWTSRLRRIRGVGRLASARPEAGALGRLVVLLALVIIWRLPATLAALSRDPALIAVELVTLVGAGTAVWLDMVGPRSDSQPLSRPYQAASAAFPMWTIWIIGYITGMSNMAPLPGRPADAALSAVADRQIAAGVMWALPTACFVPVVFVVLVAWLNERDDADPGLRLETGDGASYLRPPRGWRSRSS